MAAGEGRVREKIRSCLGNAEFKELESSLETARRKIEEYMEIYKSWEKESKMKAFSKEGLASAKIDKKSDEKAKTSTWLNDGLQTLNDMRNACEAEIEHKTAFVKKPKRGRTHGPDTKVDSCRAKLEDIKQQSKRVELMLRSLENEAVSSDQLNDVREEFEAYLQDPTDAHAKAGWEMVRPLRNSDLNRSTASLRTNCCPTVWWPTSREVLPRRRKKMRLAVLRRLISASLLPSSFPRRRRPTLRPQSQAKSWREE